MKWVGGLFLLCIIGVSAAPAWTKSRWVACTTAQGRIAPHISYDGIARCSAVFHFSGKCTGRDVLATFSGPYAVNDSEWSGLKAWEPKSISIVGATIAFIPPIEGFQYAFSGDNYDVDPIVWAKNGVGATTVFFPSGWYLQFPKAGAFKDSYAHLDVHVGCISGPFEGFLTIYYTINPN